MSKVFRFLVFIFIVLLPWQTRWIFYDQNLGGQIWEYGRLSLYASILVLVLATGVYAGHNRQELKFSKSWGLYLIFIYSLLLAWLAPLPNVALYGLLIIYLATLFGYISHKIKRDFLLLAWVVSGSLQALVAIRQFFQQSVVANKWLGLSQHLSVDLGTSVVQVGDERWLRAYGALSHPNILGGVLVIALAASIYWWHKIYQQGETSGWSMTFVEKAWWQISLVVAAIVIQTIALALSFSRGALLALVIFLVVTFIWAIKNRQSLLKQVVIKYLVILLLILGTINWYLPNAWLNRIESKGRLEDISMSERLQSWQQVNWQNPQQLFLGQGLGMNTYLAWDHSSKANKMVYDFQPIHNIYLLALAEVGIVGLLAIGYALKKYFAKKNKADWLGLGLLIAVLVLGLFDHYLWTSWTGLCILLFALINFSKKSS